MSLYDWLVGWYNQFLAVFPAGLRWLVTLVILIGLIGAFAALLHRGWIVLVLVVILLPVWVPVLQHFLAGIWDFLVFLVHNLQSTAPR